MLIYRSTRVLIAIRRYGIHPDFVRPSPVITDLRTRIGKSLMRGCPFLLHQLIYFPTETGGVGSSNSTREARAIACKISTQCSSDLCSLRHVVYKILVFLSTSLKGSSRRRSKLLAGHVFGLTSPNMQAFRGNYLPLCHTCYIT